MSDDKKYSAREAGIAVLNKVHEMLKSSDLKKSYEGFKAVEASAAKSGASDPAAVAAAAGRKKYGKEAFQEAAAKGKKMNKSNPDEKQDAQLGEDLEHLVEDHMEANKAAEKKEGHKMVKAEEDRTKMSGKSGMVRGMSATDPAQKGVNHMGNNGSSGGMSEAGNNVRNAKFGLKNGRSNAVSHHTETLKELKAMPKPNLTKAEPKGEIHPKEPQAGEAEKPGARIKEQISPLKNPKEKAEGNNEEPGTAPEFYAMEDHPGTLKLARFMGRMDSKRSSKKESV